MTKRLSLRGRGKDVYLGGSEAAPVHRLDGTTETQQTSVPSNQHDGTASRRPATLPVKTTFYISQQASEEIDDLWVSLRKRHGRDKLSKSEIATRLLEAGIKELKDLTPAQQIERLNRAS